MTGGQNHGTVYLQLSAVGPRGLNANNTSVVQQEACHFRLEMHLSTTSYNGIAQSFNHLWQFVCANVWMGIAEDARRSPMLAEHIQDFLY